MKTLLIASLLLCLAACSSPEERAEQRAAKEIAQCSKLGLVEGTQEFDDCRLQMQVAEKAKVKERTESFDSLRNIQSGRSRQW